MEMHTFEKSRGKVIGHLARRDTLIKTTLEGKIECRKGGNK